MSLCVVLFHCVSECVLLYVLCCTDKQNVLSSQKTGHAVRAIGRLSNMALMAGVHAKKGSPTEGSIATTCGTVHSKIQFCHLLITLMTF